MTFDFQIVCLKGAYLFIKWPIARCPVHEWFSSNSLDKFEFNELWFMPSVKKGNLSLALARSRRDDCCEIPFLKQN